MGYISDMTRVLLDEIAFAEKLIEYGEDIAYGYWFQAKARSMVEQIETDFTYYIEVTDIKKRMIEDKTAESVYNHFVDRIQKIAQACGQFKT